MKEDALLRKDKILIVDDEEKLLKLFARQLQTLYSVKTATSGDQALEIINNSGPFAVVISDFRMPEMNGVEFLAQAKEIEPDTIRMMISGFADLEVVMEAINEGNIFRFLTKPCKPDIFSRAVQDGVRQYHLVQQERQLAESKRIQKFLEKAKDKLKEVVKERTREISKSNEKLKREIEERRRAEKKLNESMEILQLAMDNIPQSIFWKDSRSVYLGCNKNFANLVGVGSPEDITGRSDDSLGWSEAPTLSEFGEFAMEADMAMFDIIEEFRETEGRTFYWEVGSFPYHDEEGTVVGVLGSLEDVSEKIESEEALIRREKTRSISRIAAALLNELKEPFEVLSESEKILSTTPPDHSMHGFISKVNEQASLIRSIMDKLDKLAKRNDVESS